MNLEKIKKQVDEDFEELCEDCFAKWIIAIWNHLSFEGNSLEEHKESFFYAIERLLKEKLIKLHLPLNDPRDTDYWEDDVQSIVQHLRINWPAGVRSESESEIIDYFYDTQRCPTIFWLDENGEMHGG